MCPGLQRRGYRCSGIDLSPKMIAIARAKFRDIEFIEGDIERLPFADATFDGAVAWGVMFHLPQAEEIKVIASVARVLKPGGSFLFTAGDVVDDSRDHIGIMNGVEFHYYSFTTDGYRRVLVDHGLHLVDFHKDKGENGYYLAAKRV